MVEVSTNARESGRLARLLFAESGVPAVIEIEPGLPVNLSRPDGDDHIYPTNTVDVAKILRHEGFTVVFPAGEDDRVLVGHFAADVWLPILQFASSMLAGASGNLISGLIERLFHRESRKSVVHIHWKIRREDGRVVSFDFDGPVEAAKAAADVYEASLRRELGGEDD